jgi:hypothetical protein
MKGDSCNVEKNSKERIMILLTCSVSMTYRLPPLVTGGVKILVALKTSECFPQSISPAENHGL